MEIQLDRIRTVFFISCLSCLSCLLVAPAGFLGIEAGQRQQRQEEGEDYFRKWLTEDVTYIITSQERAVFEKLSSSQEREQFIEQFWLRRDPDRRTDANEYKDEHYRRIAYANERFTSGIPGWKTDRGQIYIIHGKPVEIEKHRSGESYERPMKEGGGFTSVYAFEVWRYRHIEGIGPDVELEFVDPSGSGEFRLARTPWEKDAGLFTPGMNLTIAEELGMATRGDHPYFSPFNADRYFGMGGSIKDNPFIRYETLINSQRALPIKYNDLKAIVAANVTYDNIPFQLHCDYFQLNDRQVLVPITIEFQNKELTFQIEQGNHVARVAVYGIVSSMTNRVVSEFDHDLMLSYAPQDIQAGLQSRSVYQKMVPVENQMRYKVSFVVKDLNSGRVGVVQQAIIPPSYKENQLGISSLILSGHIYQLNDDLAEAEMFVIGDVKVRPNVRKVFKSDDPFGVYLHAYNLAVDQNSFRPSLTVTYQLYRKGKVVLSVVHAADESIQFASPRRVVLVKPFRLSELETGRYRLKVAVEDRLREQTVSTFEDFEIQQSGPGMKTSPP